MPLGMCGINSPVRAWLVPHLPPTRPHQQNIALLDLYLLRFGGILEIFQRDPIPAGQGICALVLGDIEQDPAPDHRLDTRRIAMHRAIRSWRRRIVVYTVFPIDMGKGVQMRARMVMHEGETGRTLTALRVELPRLPRSAIISIALLDDLDADARWGNDPGHIVMQLLPEGIHLALLH